MERCSYLGTVVVTIATSPPYLAAAQELAASAVAVGMPCVLAALPAGLAGRAQFPLIELPLPHLVTEWLPPPEWCSPYRTERSGYRQTHILKTHAMVHVIAARLDALFVDADRTFLGNPVQTLRATGADVAAMRDDMLINIGLVWLRARASVLKVVERVANRSFAAWDQAVFNEEIAASPSVRCCYANAFVKHMTRLSEHMHTLRRANDAEARQAEQMGCAKDAAPIQALGPPASTSARLFRFWKPSAYNTLQMAWRRPLRCSMHACSTLIADRQPSAQRESGYRPLRCTGWPTRGNASWSDAQRELQLGPYAYEHLNGPLHLHTCRLPPSLAKG